MTLNVLHSCTSLCVLVRVHQQVSHAFLVCRSTQSHTGLQDHKKAFAVSNQEADYSQARHSIHYLCKVPIHQSFYCMPVHTAPFKCIHTQHYLFSGDPKWPRSLACQGRIVSSPQLCVGKRWRSFHMSLPGPISSSAMNSLSPLSPAGCSSWGVWRMRLKSQSIFI